MKNCLLILVFLCLSYQAYAQVTTVPQFPTQNDSIVIFLDTTQPGAEELLNYTGTLYAHTGINSNLGTWQHVIGNWGNNSTQPALIRLGANNYKLTVGYPRQFYSVTSSTEKILAISLVVRSADGSKQTRPDIFITLYEPGITVVFNNPVISVQFGDPLRSPAFAMPVDTINVDLSTVEIGTRVSSFTLFINDVQVAQTGSNHLSYQFIAANHPIGTNRISAVAIDTSGLIDSSSSIIFVNSSVQNAALPSGKVYGINYDNSTSVTLALFAPHKEFIYVIGDFNDWKVNTNFYMKRQVIDSNNVIWWTTITGLTPGVEYSFQYLVNGNLRIADPYTDKVLDPGNDQYISSTTYPNLKPYPSGKTNNIVSVLQTDQIPYQWQITNFQKPAKTDLVIYELLIRDFLAAHSYQALQDTLNYLKNLGVNAIELMPVNEFEGNESWGYNVSFHLAVDKYYGPKNELKKFIDKAHEMGIAVIFDMVLNHAYGQSPLVRLYWDAQNNRPAANSPWFNVVSPNQIFSYGYDFNHESQATKDYVDRVNRYWLEEFKFDGYRFDFTKGFTNTPGDGGSYDQSRINILKRMADRIWEFDSTTYVILEHFAPNSEETVLSNYGMMLWGNLNHEYSEATMGYSSDLSWGYYQSRGWQNPNLVSYMESHDEERLMYKNLNFGNSSGSYNIKDINVGINRVKLAAAFFFTIPGPKMIWQFGELGYDYSIDYNCRVCSKPIRWDYFTDLKRLKLYKVFAELIKLKKNYEVFRTGTYSTVLYGYGKKINITHPSMDVSIISNFYVTPLSPTPTFSRTGKWYEFFTGDSLDVTDVNMLVTLQPGELKIYTTVKLPTPEPDLLTDIENDFTETVPTNFGLDQNYPNPFNPSTKIKYSIPSVGTQGAVSVLLKVYDVLGNEVATLVNEEKSAGSYEVEFDASSGIKKLASGIYFYQLKVGNPETSSGQAFIETKKMILLR